jgi:hypothetical protein
MSLAIVLLWLAFFTERTCSLSASLAFSFPRRRHGPHGHTLRSIFHPHAAAPPSRNTCSPRLAAEESSGGRPVSMQRWRCSLPCTLPACDDGMTPPGTKEVRSSLSATRTLCVRGCPLPVRGRCVAAPLRPLTRPSRISHGRSKCGWPRRRHAEVRGTMTVQNRRRSRDGRRATMTSMPKLYHLGKQKNQVRPGPLGAAANSTSSLPLHIRHWRSK